MFQAIWAEIRLGHSFLLPLFASLLDIVLEVKVREQNKEESTVEEDDPAEDFGETTSGNEKRKRGVYKESHKLNKLHSCQIPGIKIKLFIYCFKQTVYSNNFFFFKSVKKEIFPKLNFLPLPPEILLNFGSHCWHKVVEIHQHMHSHVQETTEHNVTATHKP